MGKVWAQYGQSMGKVCGRLWKFVEVCGESMWTYVEVCGESMWTYVKHKPARRRMQADEICTEHRFDRTLMRLAPFKKYGRNDQVPNDQVRPLGIENGQIFRTPQTALAASGSRQQTCGSIPRGSRQLAGSSGQLPES